MHCPEKLADTFTAASQVETSECLNLDVSLRTHLAEDVQDWVSALLIGDLGLAAAHSQKMETQGYRVYVTRELERAATYARERYRLEEDKRYGLLGSSKSGLDRFGVPTDYMATRDMKVGPWYYDPPDSPWSCCQLNSAATEFQCQGLELDLPIVGWGRDLRWDGGAWKVAPGIRGNARDPYALTLNSYRVLLTRGRDGSVIFVPEAGKDYDADHDALVAAGARIL